MPSKTGRIAIALVAALVLAAILPVTVPRAADTSGEGDGLSTSFVWQAPKNLTGTFAAEIQIDPTGETWCDFRSGAEGTVREDIPLIYWARRITKDADGTHGMSTDRLFNPERVHAHAAGVETGPATPWDYGAYGQHAGDVGGSLLRAGSTANYTVAAFGIENRPDQYGDDGPMVIEITCDEPVEFTLRASRQAVGFTEQAFTDGGAGLSIDTEVNDHLIVQDNATIDAAFDTETVRLQTHLETEQNPSGTLSLDHPNGTRTWELSRDLWTVPGSPEADGVVGGPGNYTLQLSINDQIRGFGLPGVLVGLDPVESLDDVPRTCDPNNPVGEPVKCVEV